MHNIIGQSQLVSEFLEAHPSAQCKIKRLIDIVGSLIGLSILAVLLIPISVAIIIDSPGPIFFTQTRCTLLGQHFRIVKFRTMCCNAESLKLSVQNQVDGPFFKNENDPRITRVGAFLRKTSLDELPQFWNVLTGEMSLVGTRPPTLDEVAKYEPSDWQRLRVKTGMTGEWQVSKRSAVSSFGEVLKLDINYQQKWSIAYDIQLIFKTVFVLITKKVSAY